MARLLLLGCSQRKKFEQGLLPAIDRYDGPAYRVLRRYLKQNSISPVDVKILSAEYGLISSDYFLPYYDRRMTKERAQALHKQIFANLKSLLNKKSYTDILICLGKDYLRAIYGYESIIPDGSTIKLASGGIGKKLSILHDWLYGDSSNLLNARNLATPKGSIRVRGIEVNLTSEQVFDIAREAIATKDRRVTHYQSWYVLVDDQRVAPKWLVSQITGLPVSNFVTDEARRVLTQLGVEVKRV